MIFRENRKKNPTSVIKTILLVHHVYMDTNTIIIIFCINNFFVAKISSLNPVLILFLIYRYFSASLFL